MLLKRKKLLLTVISLFSLTSTPVYAEDTEPETNAKDSIDTKDMGVFLLSKVVDSETGNPLKGVDIISYSEATKTDENGEFLLKINPDEKFMVKFDKYKELVVKVSEMKGKIKLEKIPKYLPLVPMAFFNIDYINLGFKESYKKLASEGRFNDSYAVNLQGSLYNILLEGNFQNYKSELNRVNQDKTKPNEKQNFFNNTFYLRSAYLFNIIEDTLTLSGGLKGVLNLISTTNTSEPNPEDEQRDKDYLDIDHKRIGVGLDAAASFRPIRYFPLVLGAEATYYPIYSLQKNSSPLLPDSLNALELSALLRYDYLGVTTEGKFIYKNAYTQDYNSSLIGGAISFGYGF